MKSKADILIIISIIFTIVAAAVSVWQIDLWLAGTQWILVAIALGIYGVYFKDKGQAQ